MGLRAAREGHSRKGVPCVTHQTYSNEKSRQRALLRNRSRSSFLQQLLKSPNILVQILDCFGVVFSTLTCSDFFFE